MNERSAESLLHNGLPAVATETAVVDVSVIIVNYNVREFLHQALQSVCRAAGGLNVEVIVVDNNSADGSAEMVAEEFPQVVLIENRDNTGFSRANNQGIRIAQGRYLLILNPDTILQEDTLTTLVDYLDRHPEAGAVGCQILNPDGTFAPESRRAFPTPRVALYRVTGLSRLFPRSPRFGRYNMTFLPVDEESEVDALSGSCMMVRHAALYHSPETARNLSLLNGCATGDSIRETNSGTGAGLFDETFFMYGEDLDWCYRIQQAGWSIRYTPETRIIHYKGESTKKGELRYVRLFYGAMATFAEKHLQSRYSRLFTLGIHGAIFARASLSAAARLGRKALRPLLEFGIVFTIVSVLGTLILGRNGQLPPAIFFAAVAGGFALTYTLSALAVDAYASARRRRIVPVWRSLAVALIVMATASFFIKDIAFSRLLLPLSVVASGALLALFRLSTRPPAERSNERILLVGSEKEHERLRRMLANQPSGLIVAGYVEVDESRIRRARANKPLGPLRQLRDIIRLHQIDEVFFASSCISNQEIFHQMQLLRDLPAQFRILADGPDIIIGKASIDDFSTAPIVDAASAVQSPRTRLARRAFELPIALAWLAVYPLAVLMDALEPRRRPLRRVSASMFDVLLGRKALVGYDESGPFIPPDEWRLKPGVFFVTEAGNVRQDHERVYWFYMQHQSSAMDWDIMRKSLSLQ